MLDDAANRPELRPAVALGANAEKSVFDAAVEATRSHCWSYMLIVLFV